MADTDTPRERPVSLLGKAALSYAAKGYRVFPLEPRGKTPRTEHGVKDATTDAARVTAWWRAIPDANIGIATGAGLLVLDIDGEAGAASLAELIDLYGPLPLTPTQKTGKGRHYLFAVDGPVKNSASRIAPGIDTRGDGGYIVGGPSIHPSGEPYAWDADARPSKIPAALCPQWILDRLAPKISERAAVQQPPAEADRDTLSKYAGSALDAEFSKVSGAGKGTRNATLNAAAFSLGQLVGAGLLPQGLVVSTLQAAAQNCGYLAEEGAAHVDRIIASGLEAGIAKPRVVELKRTAAVTRREPARQASGSSGPDTSRTATVHALDDARPPPAPASFYRESVWLADEPEDFVLTKDGGKLGSSTHNMLLHLKHERALAGLFALDERSRHIVLTRDAPWGGSAVPHRLLTDADITGLVCLLETRTLRPKFNDAKRAIQYAAHDNPVNPVRDRLQALVWDGTARLDHWTVDFLGAADTSFTRQAGAKWLISAVARILRPGCKVDTMLVLEGPQGARKSSTLAALAAVLGENTFSDRLSKLDGKDAVIELQGQVIVEIAELDAFRNSAVSLIKAFLSRQVDKIRLPWDATVTELQRSCVFAGTVNPGGAGWMHDVTGGRRFWPMEVGQIDLAGLAEAAPQLWAEASARYAQGEEWWLTDEVVIAEANRAAMDRTDEDVWAPYIDTFITTRDRVTISEVLEALGMAKDKQGDREQKRVAAHLYRRGFNRVRQRDGASQIRVYVREFTPKDA
jgi:predicted P-loop ATPase